MKKLVKPEENNSEKIELEVNALTESPTDCITLHNGSCGCYGFSKFWADDDNDDILF
jgi:hypothetical protein